MTDSIDLDEMEIEDGDDDDSADVHWFWHEEGTPSTERGPSPGSSPATKPDGDEEGTRTDDSREGNQSLADDTSARSKPLPRVPRSPSTPDGPVGVPENQGGSGGGTSSQPNDSEGGASPARTTNHGDASEPDDMTLAITYEAINRLEDPQVAMGDARGWTDWIGIVGKVSTPAIRKFQRDEMIDLDFFGGSEQGPVSRLTDITPESMFYAERMVLIGVTDDAWIADEADWEFIPLEEAAEKADWTIEYEE